MIFLLVIHEGCDGMTLIGMVARLTTNMDSGVANPKMVGGAGDGTERRRH